MSGLCSWKFKQYDRPIQGFLHNQHVHMVWNIDYIAQNTNLWSLLPICEVQNNTHQEKKCILGHNTGI